MKSEEDGTASFCHMGQKNETQIPFLLEET
jgi:hypothetical protein